MSKPTLFFGPSYKVDFDWRGKHKLRLGSLQPSNRHQIDQGLKHLSSESIRNRFLGSKKEFSDAELKYLTELDGWNHYALGIEERERPHRGVAVIRMVRSALDPGEAEVAITIIDEYQNLGLGTLLMQLMALAADEREIERMSFTYLPQNEGIVRLIHKLGKPRTSKGQMDYVQQYMDVKNIDLEGIQQKLTEFLK